ncbi:MAG: acyl-CoA dehydrogenase, partial [Novosphingobium sp.]
PEQEELRRQSRRYLQGHCDSAAVRRVLEGENLYDRALWYGLAELGLLGAGIAENYGGAGLGYLELCVIAEELGRALAPVPFSSSIYLAAEFLKAAGSENQKRLWLPRLANGSAVGTFALVERGGAVDPDAIVTRYADGALAGGKMLVPDGGIADFAIVAARSEQGLGLYLVELDQDGVERSSLGTVDPTREHSSLRFEAALAEPLGDPASGMELIETISDRAAVLTAFEQVGGAEAALFMARDYARERMAFGRQIGSFQAIKHMLADMYVSLTLARSNAYFGAWALSQDNADLPAAAATARVSATQAYLQCARNNIQVHGGIGFTWAADCHLHYRRANLLALSLGGPSQWEDALVTRLRRRAV